MRLPQALVFLAISFCAVAFADIGKEAWKSSFLAKGPSVLCKGSGGMIQKCFSMSDSDCEKAMTTAIGQCLKEVDPELPANIPSPNNFGEMIGACAQRQVANNNSSKLVSSKECKDYSSYSRSH